MTRIQKANIWMLVITIIVANVVYFGRFYHNPFSLETLLVFVSVSFFTIIAYYCFVLVHGLVRLSVPNKEPMLHRIEIPSFMASGHFYYDSDYQIRLGEKAPPELIKEVNDYIENYNDWFEEWQRNKNQVSGE